MFNTLLEQYFFYVMWFHECDFYIFEGYVYQPENGEINIQLHVSMWTSVCRLSIILWIRPLFYPRISSLKNLDAVKLLKIKRFTRSSVENVWPIFNRIMLPELQSNKLKQF